MSSSDIKMKPMSPDAHPAGNHFSSTVRAKVMKKVHHYQEKAEPVLHSSSLKGNKFFHGGLVPGFAPDAAEDVDNRADCDRPGMWGLLLGKDEVGHAGTLRSAITEFNATAIWVFFHIGIARAAGTYEHPALMAAIGHFVLVVLLTFSFAAPSGAHMNPNITLATMLIGHTTVYRYLMYTVFQFSGGMLGATLMRLSLGWDDVHAADLAACSRGVLKPYSALTITTVVFHMLLCVIGGVAFDPAQSKVFGPIVAPIIIAGAIFLIIYSTSAAGEGFGPGLNWVECWTKSAVTGEWNGDEWISLVGPTIACCVHSMLFVLVPPTHSDSGTFRLPLLEPLRRAEEKANLAKKEREHQVKWESNPTLDHNTNMDGRGGPISARPCPAR